MFVLPPSQQKRVYVLAGRIFLVLAFGLLTAGTIYQTAITFTGEDITDLYAGYSPPDHLRRYPAEQAVMLLSLIAFMGLLAKKPFGWITAMVTAVMIPGTALINAVSRFVNWGQFSWGLLNWLVLFVPLILIIIALRQEFQIGKKHWVWMAALLGAMDILAIMQEYYKGFL